MLKKFLLSILFITALISPNLSLAQSAGADEYLVGRIISIEESKQNEFNAQKQIIKAVIIKGGQKGQAITITQEINKQKGQTYSKDQKIIIGKISTEQSTAYFVQDTYRYPALITSLCIFLLFVLFIGRWQGARSLLGLLFSILIISKIMVPLYIRGWNPLFVSVLGALFISIVSIYVAHGIKRRTHIALSSMIATFSISAVIAIIMVNVSKLFGLGSEEAAFLIGDAHRALDLKGLLLGGIIIGMLGVLDDITTAQAAAVDEIYKANPKYTFKQLYDAATSIGKEHISSLVNTLALAYAGASLPLFLLFTINTHDPSWVIINSEFIAEEIIRTLAGSFALILAVPLTTILAVFINKELGPSHDEPGHTHHH